jgi:hypothetical protein
MGGSIMSQLSPSLLAWLGGISAVMFIGSLVGMPFLLARIPADFFVRKPARRERFHSTFRWIVFLLFFVLKNVVGLILVFAGILMLFLPGQGVITIFLGIALMDLPGKRALLKRIVSRPSVRKGINWIRKKAGAEPLILPDENG